MENRILNVTVLNYKSYTIEGKILITLAKHITGKYQKLKTPNNTFPDLELKNLYLTVTCDYSTKKSEQNTLPPKTASIQIKYYR